MTKTHRKHVKRQNVSPCEELHQLINDEIEDERFIRDQVKLLLKSGATINYTDYMGRSALHNAAVYDTEFEIKRTLCLGTTCQHIKKAKLIMSASCECFKRFNPQLSIEYSSIVDDFLNEFGEHIDFVTKKGFTPLAYALSSEVMTISRFEESSSTRRKIGLTTECLLKHGASNPFYWTTCVSPLNLDIALVFKWIMERFYNIDAEEPTIAKLKTILMEDIGLMQNDEKLMQSEDFNFKNTMISIKVAFTNVVGRELFTEFATDLIEMVMGEKAEWSHLTNIQKERVLVTLECAQSPSLSTKFAKVGLADIGQQLDYEVYGTTLKIQNGSGMQEKGISMLLYPLAFGPFGHKIGYLLVYLFGYLLKFSFKILEPWLEQIAQICDVIDASYEQEELDNNSHIFQLKHEFQNLSFQLMTFINCALEDNVFVLTDMSTIGEHLVKFVTISGVTSFKESLKAVLNLSYDLDDQLLMVFLSKMSNGDFWHELLTPLRDIFQDDTLTFSPVKK